MLRKIRKLLKKQEGFTLVELMIVVVILGILAGIGVQQYGNIQERAKKAADDANKKVLTNAANMWLIMNDGFRERAERRRHFQIQTIQTIMPWLITWMSGQRFRAVTSHML